MKSESCQSKKIYLIAILLTPLPIASLYLLFDLNSDIMWRFNMMLAKGYWQFSVALMIYLAIAYLALRIFRSQR